jgi:pyridoxal/pyridoxine/pyridoxamine kinase
MDISQCTVNQTVNLSKSKSKVSISIQEYQRETVEDWNKLIENSASCWCVLYGYITMHDQQNIKFVKAQKAKPVHLYKNIKGKLYKTNSAIWYNQHYYTNCCLYTVDPPHDEHQACSKHVEAYYWNTLTENNASCWCVIYGYITMHDQQNSKNKWVHLVDCQ